MLCIVSHKGNACFKTLDSRVCRPGYPIDQEKGNVPVRRVLCHQSLQKWLNFIVSMCLHGQHDSYVVCVRMYTGSISLLHYELLVQHTAYWWQRQSLEKQASQNFTWSLHVDINIPESPCGSFGHTRLLLRGLGKTVAAQKLWNAAGTEYLPRRVVYIASGLWWLKGVVIFLGWLDYIPPPFK